MVRAVRSWNTAGVAESRMRRGRAGGELTGEGLPNDRLTVRICRHDGLTCLGDAVLVAEGHSAGV